MTRCSCAVPHCSNTSYNTKPNFAFFKFSKDLKRFLQWADACNRDDIKSNVSGSYYICESHFEEHNFTESEGKKVLKNDAKPSLNMSPKNPHENIIAKRKAKFRLRRMKSVKYNFHKAGTSKETVEDKINGEEANSKSKETQVLNQIKFEKLCDEFLPPEIARFVKKQAALKSYINLHKYEPNNLSLYLKLYHTNPQVYAALKDTLGFPDRTELANHYAPLFTQDRVTLIETLKVKVQCMGETEKICSVLIRRVPLRPFLFYNKKQDKIYGFHEINGQQTTQVAQYAVVITVRGIYKDWYLPVDIALISEKNHTDIAPWFRSVMTLLFNSGLYVIVCISNIIPQIVNLTNSLKPYFVYGERKIFFMYNPDYLIFQAKRLLMRFRLQFKGLETNWEHVLKFYEIDSKKQYKLAPHLTDDHMVTENRPQAKKFTKQLLSEEVASGIAAYVDFGQIEESARGTIQYISMMAKLRALLHSMPIHSKKELNHKIKQDIVNEVYQLFRDLKVFKDGNNITPKVTLIKKILLSLNAIATLSINLREAGSESDFPLKFLSMDILNKSILGLQKKSNSRRFTCLSLIREFKKKFYYEVMKPNENESAKDLAKILANFFRKRSPPSEKVVVPQDLLPRKWQPRLFAEFDNKSFVMPKKHQLLYVCGFVLRETCERHRDCADTMRYVTFDESDEDNFGIYLEYREVCSDQLPMIPPDSLVVFVQKLDAELQNFFRSAILINGEARSFMPRLSTKLAKITFQPPCGCFPQYYLKELFIRIKLFHLISMNNKDYRTQPSEELAFRFQYFV